MVDRYVVEQVAKALDKAKGDRSRAHRLLVKACGADDRLLHALVAPFLNGIVGHAIERQLGGARPDRRRKSEAPLTERSMEALVGRLGRTIGASTEPAGMAALVAPTPKPKAGPGHEKAIRTMAAAFARKRLEG